MAKRDPKYEAFPPGDHIREEIEDRGWTQSDLARIMGRPLPMVNQLINGRKAFTARTARELEAALGPSAELWMNLETSYHLKVSVLALLDLAVCAANTFESQTYAGIFARLSQIRACGRG
jgi:addiction module HigA family antidote